MSPSCDAGIALLPNLFKGERVKHLVVDDRIEHETMLKDCFTAVSVLHGATWSQQDGYSIVFHLLK